MCKGIQSLFKSKSFTLVPVRTNFPPSSTFYQHLRRFEYFWCCYVKSYLKKIIQVHIYNPIATKAWWNFYYMLPLNGRSRAHKLFRQFLKIFQNFRRFRWTLWYSWNLSRRLESSFLKFYTHLDVVKYSLRVWNFFRPGRLMDAAPLSVYLGPPNIS